MIAESFRRVSTTALLALCGALSAIPRAVTLTVSTGGSWLIMLARLSAPLRSIPAGPFDFCADRREVLLRGASIRTALGAALATFGTVLALSWCGLRSVIRLITPRPALRPLAALRTVRGGFERAGLYFLVMLFRAATL